MFRRFEIWSSLNNILEIGVKSKHLLSAAMIIVSIMLCTEIIRAQHDFYCGHETFLNELLKESNYRDLSENLQKKYVAEFKSACAERNSNNEIILPLIVHIIHNNGNENISDQQVLRGIKYLNDAFANEGDYFRSDNTDTGIRFCLAKRNSHGEAINGILRYESVYTDMRVSGARKAIYEMTNFESEKALHLFLVKKSCLGTNCNIAGFSGLVSGIFMDAAYFGSTLNHSKVAAHEMGHYLGLYHTFYRGCENNDCLNDGDKVCDTPPDNQTGKYPCSMVFNSCRTDDNDHRIINPFRPVILGGKGDQPDLSNNFMDYIFEGCANGFTAGQSARMHFYLNTLYSSLLTSKSCLPPCSNNVTAAFDTDSDTIFTGEILNVLDKSENAFYYRWYLDGVFISDLPSPALPFTIPGRFTLRLEVSGNDPACDNSVTEKMITVLCGVRACFESEIRYPYLIFRDCSVGMDSIRWSIRKNGKDVIYNGSNIMDSVYINNISTVQICLHSIGTWCSDTYCSYIDIQNDGAENCYNGIDDDGDGLVDLFDPDCPCNNTAYQAHCPSDCPLVPDSFPDFKMKLKWVSDPVGIGGSITLPVVGDIDGDGNIEVFIVKLKRISNNIYEKYLTVLDGKNGTLKNEVFIAVGNPSNNILSLFDYNADGKAEICVANGNELRLYDFNLNHLYTSDLTLQGIGNFQGITDFNGDGVAEIYNRASIFNSQNGKLLIDLMDYGFCEQNPNTCIYSESIAADVLPTPGLEYIIGNTVYSLNIENYEGKFGNSVSITKAPDEVLAGKTAVADFDGDGNLDIVSLLRMNTNNAGGLWIWNPILIKVIARGNVFQFGGIPVIGDVDGDCIPEICIIFKNQLWLYKYDGTQELKVKYVIPIIEGSGVTAVSMFDFNQDGILEIVYKDEENLMIIDGPTGIILNTTPLKHGTGLEYPIIADVDGNGQANILVTGYSTNISNGYRIYCYESDGAPWAPARSVWNQYNYNPLYVNDDLTIPRYPQNPAQPLQGTEHCPQMTCSTPYNNFMVQATYRTQEGCYVWPGHNRDLTITATSRCLGDSIEICFSPRSSITGDSALMVYVSCFLPDMGIGSSMIDKIAIRSDTCIRMQKLSGVDSMFIVINETGGIFPPSFANTSIAECDYTNNVFVLDLKGPDLTIDILSYECTGDSLIFYIISDNKGAQSHVPCISGGCYFTDPMINGGQNSPLEITEWCFKYDNIRMRYHYRDTFRVAIALPAGQTGMWWTINEGGFGPGLASSVLTDIYECNYNNNTAYISFDLTEKSLDLGPDIIKCSSEVITLDAGAGFSSYLWSDLSTEAVYSTSFDGLHYVEATDQCGRIYIDSIRITTDHTTDLDLGSDISICPDEQYALEISYPYDVVRWFPADMVDCDTCLRVHVHTAVPAMLIAVAQIGECISVDSIFIDIQAAHTASDYRTICRGETVEFYGDIISAGGTYSHTTGQCDTVFILHLEVAEAYNSLLAAQVCRGDSVLFNGRYFHSEGMYSDTLHTTYGCDSIIHLQLSIAEPQHHYLRTQICAGDSVNIDGEWITEPWMKEIRLSSLQTGCDSIVTFEVIVLPLVSDYREYRICAGDSVWVHDRWIASSGIFIESYTGINGCDSISRVEVRVSEQIRTQTDRSICTGDSVFIHGLWIKEAGIYESMHTAAAGCDSISVVHLEILPVTVRTDSIRICAGDTLEIQGQLITTAGVYPYTVPAQPCDEQVTAIVQALPVIAETVSFVLCPGDTLWYRGQEIIRAGSYHIHEINAWGCTDSYTAEVYMPDVPDAPVLEADCDNGTVQASVDASDIWHPVWSNDDTTRTTVYHEAGPAHIVLFTDPDCAVRFEWFNPDISSLSDLPVLHQIQVQPGTGIPLSTGLDSTEWEVRWSPAWAVSCTACTETIVNTDRDTELTVTMTHISGCVYSQTVEIRVSAQDWTLANVFSPGSDGPNRLWQLHVPEGITLLECYIYDRWGNVVADLSNGKDSGWDGSYQGSYVLPAVYVYLIRYKDSEGKIHVRRGDVTVVR